MVTSPDNAIMQWEECYQRYIYCDAPLRSGRMGISPYLMIKVQFSNVFLDHFLPTVSTTIKLTIPMIKGRRIDTICNVIALPKWTIKKKECIRHNYIMYREDISHLTASFLRRINQRNIQIKLTGNENRLKIKSPAPTDL